MVDSGWDLTGAIYSMGLFSFNRTHLFVRRLALALFNFSGGKKSFLLTLTIKVFSRCTLR